MFSIFNVMQLMYFILDLFYRCGGKTIPDVDC